MVATVAVVVKVVAVTRSCIELFAGIEKAIVRALDFRLQGSYLYATLAILDSHK